MANKRLHPDFIKEAISQGEDDLAKSREAKALKQTEEEAKLQEYALKVKAHVEKWAVEELPKLMREHTAKNDRKISLGSVDTDKISLGYGIETMEKVRLVRAMGLDVEEAWYEPEHDPDGAYSHGSGTSYTLVW